MLLFLYGPWADPGLRACVIGSDEPLGVEATLPDHHLRLDQTNGLPGLVATPGERVEGVIVDLGRSGLDRFDYYATALGAVAVQAQVETETGRQSTQLFRLPMPDPSPDEPWSLAAWRRDWAAIECRYAAEVLGRMGLEPAHQAGLHLSQARVRAASFQRAQANSAPVIARSSFDASTDVESPATRRPYRNFFMAEEQEVAFRRFDGSMSDAVTRAAFVMGDATTVLPYDPVRDRVLLVEQFRFGPYIRGDRHPWSLEPIAGRIDPGETPEQAAHREALEEAGLTLRSLEPVARYYPSPGAATEYLFTFVGLTDLPDGVARIAGLEEEAEDIRGVLLPFDEALALVSQGEAENGPLIATLFWLALNRDRLRIG